MIKNNMKNGHIGIIKSFNDFIRDNLDEGYLRRVISSEINNKERTEDGVRKEIKIEKIKSWLEEVGISKYLIDDKTLEIDVDEDVHLQGTLKKINNGEKSSFPDYIKFREINGDFDISYNELVSLEGCPDIVKGYFFCYGNNISDLKYCPSIIKGDFNCCGCGLYSLSGCPKEVCGNFMCSGNNLIDLKGCPEIVKGKFECSNNTLETLDTGHHKKVKVIGDFVLINNYKKGSKINRYKGEESDIVFSKRQVRELFDVKFSNIFFDDWVAGSIVVT